MVKCPGCRTFSGTEDTREYVERRGVVITLLCKKVGCGIRWRLTIPISFSAWWKRGSAQHL